MRATLTWKEEKTHSSIFNKQLVSASGDDEITWENEKTNVAQTAVESGKIRSNYQQEYKQQNIWSLSERLVKWQK